MAQIFHGDVIKFTFVDYFYFNFYANSPLLNFKARRNHTPEESEKMKK